MVFELVDFSAWPFMPLVIVWLIVASLVRRNQGRKAVQVSVSYPF